MADAKKAGETDWRELVAARAKAVEGATERIHRNLDFENNPDAFANYKDPKRPDDVAAERMGRAVRATWMHGDPYRDEIIRYASEKGVSPAIPLAILAVEQQGNMTRGDYSKVSPKGATGLMQLMEDTAKKMGVKDRNDPIQSIRGAVDTIAELQTRLGTTDPYFLAASYNAGDKIVRDYAQATNDLPLETKKYLAAFRPAYIASLDLNRPKVP